ncbi:MAG TPA: glycosyl transferase family 51, partial [Selenomonas sp.]|nr:glycosyl transferase family 51 [Selenomonas sp.]
MRKTKKRRIRNRVLRFLFTLMLVFFIAFFLSGGIWLFHPRTWQNVGDMLPRLERQLPAIEDSEDKHTIGWTDRISRFIFLKRAVNSRVDRGSYVPLNEIPDSMKQAIVAVEESRFYSHHGFDLQGIARASLVNLQYGQIEEGASTITQQLVKNLFLSNEKSFGRKAEELALALDM